MNAWIKINSDKYLMVAFGSRVWHSNRVQLNCRCLKVWRRGDSNFHVRLIVALLSDARWAWCTTSGLLVIYLKDLSSLSVGQVGTRNFHANRYDNVWESKKNCDFPRLFGCHLFPAIPSRFFTKEFSAGRM